ncbi:PREDICTED: isoleucine--tRNA ligase, cytoplasmic-like [Colobus angolensis palliatus]|uniref:isoleucine--tRNA ligase, cytoplasmic-like n=1 Tax=Colobus angolensis palliatus TaxID=336983 RepID=UPI0005F435B4|nr:PREDICTED: isoleucine--tRNA ligase, cytoplasmic-like [Colobus angolensis palliatus]
MVQQVPENINFPAEEEKILEFWTEFNCFQECLKQSKHKPKFTFYDGPPFATGLPHYGHILAGTIKDIVTRYAHQSGFHVDRRFGWDCHGLPVVCLNFYFISIYDKGLVYRGVKVMPFSTACNTPLSNFESHQNYKDVQDPSVFVTFPLEEDETVSLVAWTTTPWTLPSNLAVCVNPEMQYVKIKDVARGKLFILMEARLSALYKLESDYEILERFPGSYLKGKKYRPLFDYFTKYPFENKREFEDAFPADFIAEGIDQTRGWLYTVVPRLVKFVDILTNWYVRMNRRRLKELNVRKVTLSTDKNKYGIRLRAEPDHMVLGKRLKGAFKAVMTSIKQLSSEELEQFQKTGPACAYVNLNICANGSEQGGVLLLENPKGDNRLDLIKLKSVVTSIFGVKNTELAVFHDETEIQNETDLLSLSGKTLCVTAGSAPSLISSSSTLLCQYINLQLLNAEPQECLMGTVGTLLLENPLGQNGLTHQGLLYEAAKVFGLRSRLEITEDIPVKTLNMKTVYVSVLPTTADF